LRRAQRAAEQPGAVAKRRARQRAEIARQIVRALRGCDEPRARELIDDAVAVFGGDDYGRNALVAAVQEQARMAALEAPQESDQWSDDSEPEPSYDLDDSEFEDEPG
jgi:hypothetical protein